MGTIDAGTTGTVECTGNVGNASAATVDCPSSAGTSSPDNGWWAQCGPGNSCTGKEKPIGGSITCPSKSVTSVAQQTAPRAIQFAAMTSGAILAINVLG